MDDKSVDLTGEDRGPIAGKTFPKQVPNKSWWAILAVQLIILVLSGYLAFIHHEGNLALDMEADKLAAAFSDEATKAKLLESVRTDEEEQADREELALHVFNISLGALLGFLSSSAASRIPTGKYRP